MWALTLLVRQLPGYGPGIIMIVFSIIASSRYIWWRLTQTMDLNSGFEMFFGSGLDASLGSLSSGFFSSAANRSLVEQALVQNAVGNANPQVATAVTSQVDALLQKIPSINAGATVSQSAVAACTAVLGSAAVTLQ